MAYTLEQGKPVPRTIRRIVAAQIKQAIGCMGGGRTPRKERFHQARKDLKKARAALRLVRGVLPERQFRRENRRCRDAARVLSDIRDAQLWSDTLDQLLDRAEPGERAGFAVLRRQLRAESERIVLAVTEQSRRIEPAVETLRRARRAACKLEFRQKGWKAIRDGLTASYRATRRSYRRAVSEGTAVQFHEWRKEAKYLRHHLELLEAAAPEELANITRDLHRLTDVLGQDHDLESLRAVVQERFHKGESGGWMRRLSPLIDARQTELRTEAKNLASRLLAERPRAFRLRMHRYWKAWRAADSPAEGRRRAG